MSTQVVELDYNPLTEGNITKSILRLALPVVASTALHNVFHIADTWWVSNWLGPEATAAVGSSGFVVWSVFSLGSMVSVGVSAMVSRFVGAKDRRMTGEVVYQGLILAVVLSILVTVIGLVLRGPVYGFLNAEKSVNDLAESYLRVILLGVSTLFVFVLVTAIFRASGDTTTPLLLLLASGFLNFVLDPLLMLGWGPFPRLEVMGTAIATVVSRLVGLSVGMYLLLRGKAGGKIDWHFPRWVPDLSMHRRILRIGIPTSLAGLFFSIVYLCLLRVIAEVAGDLKTASVAALTIGFRVESLAFMWSMGFSAAASTLVGQNLGAGQADRAAQCAWRSAAILCAVSGSIGVVMMIIPRPLVGFFSKDPEVIALAASYVWVMGLIQVPQSLASVLRGAFSGAGNTLPTLLIEAPLNFARIPLGYLLAVPLGMGIHGVWWAIGLSSLGKGISIGAWFYRGRWKEHQV